MKLVKYLADYIEHELADNSDLTWIEIIQQAIEAFESTEAVKVLVVDEEIAYKIEQQIKDGCEL